MERSQFQFKRPVLQNINFVINDNFDESQYKGINIQSETRVKKCIDNCADVSFCLHIGEKGLFAPFWLSIEMISTFKWSDNMKSELVDSLLKSNAPSLILGYIRPIVSNITINSKYPAFDIPFIDMQNNKVAFVEE